LSKKVKNIKLNQYNYKKELDKQLNEKNNLRLNSKKEEKIWIGMEQDQIRR
jgi:hypothetical protein